jgi:hypothetical protein
MKCENYGKDVNKDAENENIWPSFWNEKKLCEIFGTEKISKARAGTRSYVQRRMVVCTIAYMVAMFFVIFFPGTWLIEMFIVASLGFGWIFGYQVETGFPKKYLRQNYPEIYETIKNSQKAKTTIN